MKKLILISLILFTVVSFAQNTKPFNVSFNLAQITLPGAGKSVAGAETDVILPFTTNNLIGMSTLVSADYNFIAGRYDRNFPSISKYLNNISPNLNFLNSEIGVTGSVGVVHANTESHWGERAGVFWRQNINETWAMGFEAQWVNLPGYQHNTYSVAVGPSIHF